MSEQNRAMQHPHERAEPIERVETIDPGEFGRDYVGRNRPLVISQATGNWPALQRWSFPFFRELDSSYEVTLEIGDVLVQEPRFEKLPFSAYIERIEAGTVSGESYLSLFEIFRAFPQLRGDVDFDLLARHKVLNELIGWIGPQGTVTNYHFDRADTLIGQIVGRKRFFLVEPAQSTQMVPSPKYDWFSGLSQVDAQHWDAAKHPQFAEVRALTAELAPGELLFIPKGWWHHVESLSPSVSVSNFGLNLRELLLVGARELSKEGLHRVGLYARQCTCHRYINGRRVRRG